MGSASSRPQAEDVGKDASSDMANSKGIPSEKVSTTDVTDEVFLANDDMDDDVFDDENDNRKFKDSSKQDAVKTQYGDDIDMDIKNLEKDLDDALSEPVILASSKCRAGLRTSQSTLPASPDSPTRNNHGGGSGVEDRTLDFWDQAREEEEILNEYNQRLLNSSGSEPTHNKESYAQRLNKQREERDSHPFRQQSNPQLKIDRNSEDWQIQTNVEGFDPKRFEAANKAGTIMDPHAANETTDMNTSSSDWCSGITRPPSYDDTEQALMDQIEEDLLRQIEGTNEP